MVETLQCRAQDSIGPGIIGRWITAKQHYCTTQLHAYTLSGVGVFSTNAARVCAWIEDCSGVTCKARHHHDPTYLDYLVSKACYGTNQLCVDRCPSSSCEQIHGALPSSVSPHFNSHRFQLVPAAAFQHVRPTAAQRAFQLHSVRHCDAVGHVLRKNSWKLQVGRRILLWSSPELPQRIRSNARIPPV